MRLFLIAPVALAALTATTMIDAVATTANAATYCRAPGVPAGCVVRHVARTRHFNSFNYLAPGGGYGPVSPGYRWPPSGGAA